MKFDEMFEAGLYDYNVSPNRFRPFLSILRVFFSVVTFEENKNQQRVSALERTLSKVFFKARRNKEKGVYIS